MKNYLKNLLANTQQYMRITSACLFVLATLGVAILAIWGLAFSIFWAYVLVNEPSALHNGEAFNAIASAWKFSVPVNFPLWTLPIKIQGLLMVFFGALSFYISSYAGEWLSVVMKMYPISKGFISFPLALTSQWTPLVSATNAWMNTIINALRKVALYLMAVLFTIVVVYYTWNILITKLPL